MPRVTGTGAYCWFELSSKTNQRSTNRSSAGDGCWASSLCPADPESRHGLKMTRLAVVIFVPVLHGALTSCILPNQLSSLKDGAMQSLCSYGCVLPVSSGGAADTTTVPCAAAVPTAQLWQVEFMFRSAFSLSWVNLQWWKQKRNKLFYSKVPAKLSQGYSH